MDGQIAVLRGEVESQHDRDLIGRMILLNRVSRTFETSWS